MNNSELNRQQGLRVLEASLAAWKNAAALRSRRERYKRYTYGDQWSDQVVNALGEVTTEREAAVSQGKRPMTNNLIRRLVKCIIGRFRMILDDSPAPDAPLRELYEANCLDELDSRALEEFLISGCAVQRVVCERRPHGEGVWVENVSPARFFINSVTDPRGWDTELVGMVHDMSMAEVVMRFSRGEPARAAMLRRLFSSAEVPSPLGLGRSDALFGPVAEGRCRVVEAWTLQASSSVICHDPLSAGVCCLPDTASPEIEAANIARRRDGLPEIAARLDMSTCWHCRWIAPDGTVLDEYDSPYPHASHPFVVRLYPLIDGEVHSLVEDVIDQQIYVNRLITLIDYVIGTSAKGALLFPVGQKPDEVRWNDLARLWASPDGVIPYAGDLDIAEPRQVISTGADAGARELLSMQLRMFDDVAGVSNALMGRASVGSGVGVERYESEIRNAIAPINDLLKTFMSFRRMRDDKMLKTAC